MSEDSNYQPDIHRLLPQAQDAERGAACSLFLAPREIRSMMSERKITSESFYNPNLGFIVQRALDIIDTKGTVDFIMLKESLEKSSDLERLGGAVFILELFGYIPTAANAKYYLDIIEEMHTLREIIKVCTKYAARSYDEQDNVAELLNGVQADIMKIGASRSENDYQPVDEIVMEACHDIESRWERKDAIEGLSTGFLELDAILDGLKNQDMIVIAARPSMGKTSLALTIAEHISLDSKLPVAFFTLERSKKQMIQCMIYSRARINARSKIRGDREFSAIQKAACVIGQAGKDKLLFFNDKTGIPWTYIAAVCRSWKKKFGIRVAFIDYLQLLRGCKQYKGDNRQAEVSEISAGLKGLSKELDMPIVVLAQINRQSEGRNGHRPRLSDLRDSGSIEQDADVVALLYREEYYCETEETKRDCEGKAEVIIAKQRNGPVGDIPLTFIKEFSRFENQARDVVDTPQ